MTFYKLTTWLILLTFTTSALPAEVVRFYGTPLPFQTCDGKQTTIRYNSNGQLKYNTLGQKTSQTFRDTRNEDFKSSDSKTLTETYSYSKDGELAESKLKTPDYEVRFDGNGKQKGEVQETKSFQAWKANEIKKAQKAAEKKARAKAEKAFLTGPPGGVVYDPPIGGGGENYGSNDLNALLNAPALNVVNLGAYRGGGMNAYVPGSFVMGGRDGSPSHPGSLLIGAALGTVPLAQQPNLQSLIARELSKIRITQPKLDTKALNQAISNAVKALIPNKTQALKVLNLVKAKTATLGKLNLSSLASSVIPANAGIQELPLGTRALIDPASLSKNPSPSGRGPGEGGGTSALFNEFGFAVPQALPPGTKVYKYDANGKLESMTQFSSDTSADGTLHQRQEITHFDAAGYETGKTLHETFKGPNVHLTVDTEVSKDGSSTSHIYGTEKDEATGQMRQIDETRKSKTVAISGGFKTVTDIVDNITGLQAKTTDKYTGVKYGPGGQMSEFTLEHQVTGQRMQGGAVVDLNIVERTKQYGAKFDDQKRMVEFKTETWSNSAPDKKVFAQVNNLSFDAQNRVSESVTQTREKGPGLDSLSVAHRSNIQYANLEPDARMVSYSEVTYSQEPMKSGAAANAPPVHGRTGSGSVTGSQAGLSSEFAQGGKLNPRNPSSSLSSFESSSPLSNNGSTLTLGSQNFQASTGYAWSSSNSSKTGLSYDHAGRLSWFLDSDNKAHHTNYDAMGLVTASKDAGVITRNIQYTAEGNRLYYETKDTTGEQSVNGQHWISERNKNGQVTQQTDILRSDGKSYSMTKHTETTFSYDLAGNQKVLHENVLKDEMDSHFTIGNAISTVTSIIGTVVGGPWGAAIAGIGNFVGAMADGKDFGEALKQGLIAAASTFMASELGGLDKLKGAESLFSIPGATTYAQVFATQAGINTLSNLAQGMKPGDALKYGAISAVGAIIGYKIGEALSSAPGIGDYFQVAGEDTTKKATEAAWKGSVTKAFAESEFYKQVGEKLITKVGSMEFAKHNDALTTQILTGVLNAAVTAGLDRAIGGMQTGTIKLEGAFLQGAAQAAFFDALGRLQKDGKVNAEMKAFLDGLGTEIVNSVDYEKLASKVNEAAVAVKNGIEQGFTKLTQMVVAGGQFIGALFSSPDKDYDLFTDIAGNVVQVPKGTEIKTEESLVKGGFLNFHSKFKTKDGHEYEQTQIEATDTQFGFSLISMGDESTTLMISEKDSDAITTYKGTALRKQMDGETVSFVELLTDKGRVLLYRNEDGTYTKQVESRYSLFNFDESTNTLTSLVKAEGKHFVVTDPQGKVLASSGDKNFTQYVSQEQMTQVGKLLLQDRYAPRQSADTMAQIAQYSVPLGEAVNLYSDLKNILTVIAGANVDQIRDNIKLGVLKKYGVDMINNSELYSKANALLNKNGDFLTPLGINLDNITYNQLLQLSTVIDVANKTFNRDDASLEVRQNFYREMFAKTGLTVYQASGTFSLDMPTLHGDQQAMRYLDPNTPQGNTLSDSLKTQMTIEWLLTKSFSPSTIADFNDSVLKRSNTSLPAESETHKILPVNSLLPDGNIGTLGYLLADYTQMKVVDGKNMPTLFDVTPLVMMDNQGVARLAVSYANDKGQISVIPYSVDKFFETFRFNPFSTSTQVESANPTGTPVDFIVDFTKEGSKIFGMASKPLVMSVAGAELGAVLGTLGKAMNYGGKALKLGDELISAYGDNSFMDFVDGTYRLNGIPVQSLEGINYSTPLSKDNVISLGVDAGMDVLKKYGLSGVDAFAKKVGGDALSMGSSQFKENYVKPEFETGKLAINYQESRYAFEWDAQGSAYVRYFLKMDDGTYQQYTFKLETEKEAA